MVDENVKYRIGANIAAYRKREGSPRLPRHRGDEGLRLLHGLEANLATSLQRLRRLDSL